MQYPQDVDPFASLIASDPEHHEMASFASVASDVQGA